MIKIAIIYKVVDICIDVVFGKIESELLPLTVDTIRLGKYRVIGWCNPNMGLVMNFEFVTITDIDDYWLTLNCAALTQSVECGDWEHLGEVTQLRLAKKWIDFMY